MRVLVVEDEARMAGLLRRGLAEEGFAVDVAASGPRVRQPAIWDSARAVASDVEGDGDREG